MGTPALAFTSQAKILYIEPLLNDADEFLNFNLGLKAREVNQEEFLEEIFGNYKGYLCIFQKLSNGLSRNVFYKQHERKKMLNYLQKTYGINTYVSYSDYYRNKKRTKDEKLRTQSNIVHTYLLCQDLDYYKLGMSDAEFLRELSKMIQNHTCICPTFIVSTGRGYQLIWRIKRFKNIAGYVNDRDWRAIQTHLFKIFEEFKSDPVVKNPSAVTRVVGTVHRATGNKVYGYKLNEAELELKDFLLFFNIIPQADRKVLPPPKTVSNITRMVKSWNAFTLNKQRETDIFTYVETMNERGQSYEGKRNLLAMIMTFHALVSTDGDQEYAKKRLEELCEIMDMNRTSVNEIMRRSFDQAVKYYNDWINDNWDRNKYVRGGLFYTNARLLDLLDIKEDYYMQWRLKTIKIKNKKYEAARKHFERLESGQIQGSMREYNERRKEQKERRITQARMWQEKGLKQQEIANKMGVSLNTVKSWFRRGESI